jgi:hypothetical protein
MMSSLSIVHYRLPIESRQIDRHGYSKKQWPTKIDMKKKSEAGTYGTSHSLECQVFLDIKMSEYNILLVQM